jgi:hypothetical protein
MTLSTPEPQTFDARSKTKQATDRDAASELRREPVAGLLSREAAAAVDTAFNALAHTVKKHEPPLEDVVRETLHPHVEVVAGRKFVELGRADGAGGNSAGRSRGVITRRASRSDFAAGRSFTFFVRDAA